MKGLKNVIIGVGFLICGVLTLMINLTVATVFFLFALIFIVIGYPQND